MENFFRLLELLAVPTISGLVTYAVSSISRKKGKEEIVLLLSQAKKTDAESVKTAAEAELLEAQADATSSEQWVRIVAELKAQMAELKEGLSVAQATILRQGKEISDLKDSNREKDRRIKELEKQNLAKDQQIADLQGEIDKLKKGEC